MSWKLYEGRKFRLVKENITVTVTNFSTITGLFFARDKHGKVYRLSTWMGDFYNHKKKPKWNYNNRIRANENLEPLDE